MANITRIVRALYCEPWLIQPEMHARLCDIARDHMTGEAHGDGGRALEFAYGDKMQRASQREKVNIIQGVAVVEVDGVIGRKFSSFINSSGVVSVDVLAEVVKETAVREDVKAILLDIDSPGGTVAGTPEAYREISEAAKTKPVVVWTGGMLASAAYWIAVGADAIFADESADVGSIGVYLSLLDCSRQFEAQGIDVELFKTGKYKAMGLPGTSLTDEQRELLQEGVDEIYAKFTSAVTSNRRVDETAMEGQTFSGDRAVEVGLIDGIMSFDAALAYAASLQRKT